MEKLKQIENNPDDFDFEEPSTEELEKQFETETLASAERESMTHFRVPWF